MVGMQERLMVCLSGCLGKVNVNIRLSPPEHFQRWAGDLARSVPNLNTCDQAAVCELKEVLKFGNCSRM